VIRIVLTVLLLVANLLVNPATAFGQSCDREASIKSQVTPFFNDISHTTRSEVIHRYGADLFERYDGPIRIAGSEFAPYNDDALIYSDKIASVKTGSRIGIRIEGETSSSIGLFLVTPNRLYLFFKGDSEGLVSLIKAWSNSGKVADSRLPNDLSNILSRDITSEEMTLKDCKWGANLPSSISEVLGWGLILSEVSEVPITVVDAGIYVDERSTSVLLTGKILGHPRLSPGVINLTYANNEKRSAIPSLDGMFAFKDEFPNLPLKVSYLSQGQEHFPTVGRWLGYGRTSSSLEIIMDREIDNVSARRADSCDTLGRPSGLVRDQVNQRPGHYLRRWCGARGVIVEFDNTYFVNNLGMHDRDVSWRRDPKCLTIAHFGHSSVESVQVPLHLKHNVLAAEILATEIGRCVRMHTFEGNFSIASQRRLEWVMEGLKPDIVVFAMHRQMIQLLTPALLESIFGYSEGNAPNESLKIDSKGKLKYIPSNPRYALSKKVETKTETEGYPLGKSYNLPLNAMPAISKEAYDVVETALRDYGKRWSSTTFAIEFTHTYAECLKANFCEETAQFRGVEHLAGAVGYAQNMAKVCKSTETICIDGGLPDDIYRGFPDLVFQYDAHYTVKGNQYQSYRIARGLADSVPGPVLRR